MTGRLARLPLRTQLVALLLLSVALVVLVTSVAGTAALRSYLVDRIDDELVEVIRQPPQDAHGPRPGRGRKGDRRDVAVTTLLYDAQGALVTDFGTGTDEGGPDVRHPADLPTKPTDVADVDGGEGWRALALRTVTGGTYVAAVPLNGVDDTVSELLVINGAVGLMALGGVGVLAGWAVRRSLGPLRDVERTAEAIAAGDLSVRVPPAGPRTEVGSLATSFDVMVDRFESAYCAQQRSEVEARTSEQRMRRFVADASHELRTPLTSIRGFAELFRQGAARHPDQLAQVLRRIEDEASRTGLLVEDLLLLARLDQARPLRQEPVDLLTVAADVVHAATAVHAGTHEVQLDADTGPGCPSSSEMTHACTRWSRTSSGTPSPTRLPEPVSTCASSAAMATCCSRWATTARAWRRRWRRGSSSASTALTPPGPGPARRRPAAGSACRSPRRSWRPTAAPSMSTAPRAAARASSSGCRPLTAPEPLAVRGVVVRGRRPVARPVRCRPCPCGRPRQRGQQCRAGTPGRGQPAVEEG